MKIKVAAFTVSKKSINTSITNYPHKNSTVKLKQQINSLHARKFFKHFYRLLIFFFQNRLFPKILSGIPSRVSFDPEVLPGLIWVQTVSEGY